MVTINRKLALVILVVLLVGMGLVVVNMMRDGGDISEVRGLISDDDDSDDMSVVERAKARRAREMARRKALEAKQEAAKAEAGEKDAPAKTQSAPPQPQKTKQAAARPAPTKRQPVAQKQTPKVQTPTLAPRPAQSTPPSAPRTAFTGPGNALERVEVIGIDNGAVLRIVAAKPVEKFKYFTLKSPNRVVVDLYGSWSRANIPPLASNTWISKIRTGVHPDKLRIVADVIVETPGPVSAKQNSLTEIVVMLRK
jgi:hypothetical protein